MLSVVGSVFGGVTVLVAGAIAFVVTCVPIGFGVSILGGALDQKAFAVLFTFPWLIGLVVAGWAGVGTFRLIFRSRCRELPPGEGDPG